MVIEGGLTTHSIAQNILDPFPTEPWTNSGHIELHSVAGGKDYSFVESFNLMDLMK
jgi:hypothetical protein